MPWSPADASAKTKKASTQRLKRLWATVANKVLAESGDDAKAVREANAAVAKRSAKART